MRTIAILSVLLLLFLFPTITKGQFTVSYNQSVSSFAGFCYETPKGWIPTFRVGTNLDFLNAELDTNVAVEGIINYGFIRKEDYTFFGGLGITVLQGYVGGYIPVGLHIYPFPKKAFGFQMEIGPSLWSDLALLRGSIGIRYRFIKNE